MENLRITTVTGLKLHFTEEETVVLWKKIWLLFIGIGVSNTGGWVYFIALNLYVLEETDSAFAVSILYLLVPLAMLCTNFWSGSFIDRWNKKHMMIGLDIGRAVLIGLLPFISSLPTLYVVVFIINIGTTVFSTTSEVYMVKLVPADNRQRFHAICNFIQSSGFIIGPSIAGGLIFIGSVEFAIWANSFALLVSALLLMLLPAVDEKNVADKITKELILQDWQLVRTFIDQNKFVSIIYILFIWMMIAMATLDSLEASFAIKELKLTEDMYGYLVSVAGVGIAFGSFLNATLSNRLSIRFLLLFGGIGTPVGYLIFATSVDFWVAAIGFFFLTFSLSFANTGFYTFYQKHIPEEMLGRFTNIMGLMEAGFVIAFTSLIGWSASVFGIREVYFIGCILFLLLGFLTLKVVVSSKGQKYFVKQVEEGTSEVEFGA